MGREDVPSFSGNQKERRGEPMLWSLMPGGSGRDSKRPAARDGGCLEPGDG